MGLLRYNSRNAAGVLRDDTEISNGKCEQGPKSVLDLEVEKMSGDVQGALTTHGTVEGVPIFSEGGHLRSIAHSKLTLRKN